MGESEESEASTPAVDEASLAEPLSVLGNNKRLHLLEFLTEPHYIREIASELGITRQSAQAHVDKLVDLGVLERRRGQRELGSVTEYVVVPQRLFAIQEQFSRLGRLNPRSTTRRFAPSRNRSTTTLSPRTNSRLRAWRSCMGSTGAVASR
jgi:predicted transcriptional regulator